MPITSVETDVEALSLTVVAEYPVPVERLWRAWTDPRQLERFWGPPSWPATFTDYELRAGGRASYFMVGPEGQRSHGYWIFERVEPGRSFELVDGFADEHGEPDPEVPGSRMLVRFESTAQGSRFVAVSTFPSLEAMEQVLAMGALEGLRSALGQIDDVLADLRDHAAGFRAALEVLDETQARVRRVVRGTIDQVWRAYHAPDLLQTWLLGPDGWRMSVCEVAKQVGDPYRYEWEHVAREQPSFGFTGELLAFEPPHHAVTTERMIGVEGDPNTNELILTPQPGACTLIEVRITYPSQEVRDLVLGTGMVDGMEASYARMEQTVLASLRQTS